MSSLVVAGKEGRRQRLRPSHEPKVYFAASAGRIKIGTSINVHARLAEISGNTVGEISLIGTVAGGCEVERVIHAELRKHRQRREWFTDSPELRARIAEIIKNGGLTTQPPEKSRRRAQVYRNDQQATAALGGTLESLSRNDLLELAKAAGLGPSTIGRAAIGNKVSAASHLKICAAAGFDPVKSQPCAKQQVGELDRQLLAMGLFIRRRLDGHTVRDAADAMGISFAGVSRIECGHISSIGSVLLVCQYLRVHPFHYCREVSRESTETRSAA